jgi:hypothetical protein
LRGRAAAEAIEILFSTRKQEDWIASSPFGLLAMTGKRRAPPRRRHCEAAPIRGLPRNDGTEETITQSSPLALPFIHFRTAQ